MYTVKKPNPDMEINPIEETVDFDMNKVTLEPLSNDQMNEVMTEFQDDASFEDIMKTINTQDMTPSPPKAIPQPHVQYHNQPSAPQMPVQYHNQQVKNQVNQVLLMKFPVQMFSGFSNVTINYNFHCIDKTKAKISCLVTAQLIRAFVFLQHINRKILLLPKSDLVGKNRFSQYKAHMMQKQIS